MVHLVLAKNFADFTRFMEAQDVQSSEYQFVGNVNALRGWNMAVVHKVSGYTENPYYDDYFYDVLHAQEKMWRLMRDGTDNSRAAVQC